ncbi:MAG: type II toxin-antitoxin system PemK/MazF family toxin [Clostridium sp.]|nr:type II toxin-antitoxin system PemK/MazF family toxin [Clostridium sp.]MDU6345111.1 type II toxin-antitoxin system PemK/MazF family toxin [Clostridium sp.]
MYNIDFGNEGFVINGIWQAIIIQNNIGNKYSPTTIVTLLDTDVSQDKENVFEVIPKSDGSKLIVRTNLITVINKTQIKNKVGHIKKCNMIRIDLAIQKMYNPQS